MGNHICPVCGYPYLDEPAYESDTGAPTYDICPCCGCEFGYDDWTPQAKERYLKNWVRQGAPWFHPELKPPDWDLRKQLEGIGSNLDDLL